MSKKQARKMLAEAKPGTTVKEFLRACLDKHKLLNDIIFQIKKSRYLKLNTEIIFFRYKIFYYFSTLTKLFGRTTFGRSNAAENNGAMSASLNPAIPQPIRVTKNVSSGC